LVEQLSRDIDLEKMSAVKEKESLEKLEDMSTIEEVIF
jgi:hypothetical protein